MHRSRKLLLIALLCLLLVIGWFTLWRGRESDGTENLPPDQKMQDTANGRGGKLPNPLGAKLASMLTPTPSTASDWTNAKVVNGELSSAKVCFWTLLNFRPILEADTNTTAFHVHASNYRAKDGAITTTVWSNKAANALQIHWTSGAVDRKGRRIDSGPTFDEVTRESPNPNLGFGSWPPGNRKPVIAAGVYNARNEEVRTRVPFDHSQSIDIPGFISNDYPIAAIPNIDKSTGALKSIVLIDIVGQTLLGEVKLPAEAKTGRPNFILDKDSDVLLATQFGLDWLVAVDLRPYLAQGKLPAKPQ